MSQKNCDCKGFMPDPLSDRVNIKNTPKLRSVYLAGPITGCNYDECSDWRDEIKKIVHKHIECYSPMRGKYYLKKAETIKGRHQGNKPLSKAKGIVSRDRFDVYNCDIVIMNLKDAKQISIGTMVELGWADAYRKPVILIRDKGDDIHAHAFVDEISSFIVETLEEAADLVNVILTP